MREEVLTPEGEPLKDQEVQKGAECEDVDLFVVDQQISFGSSQQLRGMVCMLEKMKVSTGVEESRIRRRSSYLHAGVPT